MAAAILKWRLPCRNGCSHVQKGVATVARPIRNTSGLRFHGMPNVRAANKVKIGAWIDRMDAANLRRLAKSRGKHLSELIEEAMHRELPRLTTEAGADGSQGQAQLTTSAK